MLGGGYMPLIDFIADYADEPWNWVELSRNPSIGTAAVQAYPNFPWIWTEFLKKSSISLELLIGHSWVADGQAGIPWKDLSSHPDLTWDLVQSVAPDQWCWHSLSAHRCVSMDLVRQNPQMPWKWASLSQNPNLDLAMVLEHLDKDWDWFWVSRMVSRSCPQEFLKHLELPWNWAAVSQDIVMTEELLDSSIPWYYDFLSMNSSVTMAMVETRGDRPWTRLSNNPNVTVEFIQAHPEYTWDWEILSYGLKADVATIQRAQLPICWTKYSRNPAVTLADVLAHPELPWDWIGLSSTVPITVQQFVETRPRCPWSLCEYVRNRACRVDDLVAHWNTVEWLFADELAYERCWESMSSCLKDES